MQNNPSPIAYCLCISIMSVQLSGCYDLRMISKEQVSEHSLPIILVTVDGRKYRFEEYSYRMERDTLSGKGIRVFENRQVVDFEGRIALDSIATIETFELNETRTVYSSLGVIAGVVLFVALLISVFGPPFDINLAGSP